MTDPAKTGQVIDMQPTGIAPDRGFAGLPAAVEPGAPPTLAVPLTPMAMIGQAVASGASIETLSRLMDLHERWERGQARKAFDEAMAAARAEFKPIIKNREVDFTSTKGRTNYRHEDLAEVARTVDPVLARHGLSYRFRTTSATNEPISVTCIVSHRLGHSEENTLFAGRDDSGNKNSIQGIGSTITYLQRYTLKAALGLAASNDDDGAAAGGTEDDGPITDAQFAQVQDLIDRTGSDVALFCKAFRIPAVAALPASSFGKAKAQLEAKLAKKKENT